MPGKAKAHLSALGVLSWGPSNRPCDFLPREIATYNYRNECQQMAQLRAGVRNWYDQSRMLRVRFRDPGLQRPEGTDDHDIIKYTGNPR